MRWSFRSFTRSKLPMPGNAVPSALAALALLLAAAAPAAAQTVGVRAGVSGDPDQFIFGGHFETAPIIENLTFRPNAEIGLGDDVTTVALNIEFAYWIPIRNSPWSLYAGGGPAANIYSFDDDFPGPRDDDTEVRGGFNLLVGIQHDRGLFAEFKVGTIDSPDIKFTVGYAFK